jgi:hypothetical protein
MVGKNIKELAKICRSGKLRSRLFENRRQNGQNAELASAHLLPFHRISGRPRKL